MWYYSLYPKKFIERLNKILPVSESKIKTFMLEVGEMDNVLNCAEKMKELGADYLLIVTLCDMMKKCPNRFLELSTKELMILKKYDTDIEDIFCEKVGDCSE